VEAGFSFRIAVGKGTGGEKVNSSTSFAHAFAERMIRANLFSAPTAASSSPRKTPRRENLKEINET
jgi:hypothetical protein